MDPLLSEATVDELLKALMKRRSSFVITTMISESETDTVIFGDVIKSCACVASSVHEICAKFDVSINDVLSCIAGLEAYRLPSYTRDIL